MKNIAYVILMSIALYSCNIEKGVIVVRLGNNVTKSFAPPSLTSVQLINHQFILVGKKSEQCETC